MAREPSSAEQPVKVVPMKSLKHRALSICEPSKQQKQEHPQKEMDTLTEWSSCPTQKSNPSGEENKDESESEEHKKDKNEEAEEGRYRTLSTLYVKGLLERIERECRAIGSEKLKLAFWPSRTIRQSLIQVKNRIPPEKKKGVVYEI